MEYIIHNSNIKVDTDKKWLKRNSYSKDSIKVYGVLAKAKTGDNISNEYLATNLRMSKTRLEEAKRELVFCGLLESYRKNTTTMVYLVGQYEIGRHTIPEVPYEELTHMPYLKGGKKVKTMMTDKGIKVLAGIDVRPTKEDIKMAKHILKLAKQEEEKASSNKYTDLDKLKKEIPTPSPINLTEEDIL